MTATQHAAYATSANNLWLTDGTYTVQSTGTGTLNTIQMNKIQQTKVAVFYITRNDNQEIINTEFLKEMWIQTKAGSSVEFEVARDKDLSKYKSTDLVIKVITSIVF